LRLDWNLIIQNFKKPVSVLVNFALIGQNPIQFQSLGAFHLVTQVDTNVISSFFIQ